MSEGGGVSPLIVHVITGLGDGGAEGVLYRLCKHDNTAQHVVISLMDGGRYAGALKELGVPVHSLGLERGRIGPRAVLRLRALMRQHRPDTVQTWMYHADLLGGIVARMARVPHISWGIRHGELAPGNTKRSTLAIVRLCARLSRSVPHAIISCSSNAKDLHIALGYDPRKFRVVPNGYDDDSMAPDPEARRSFRTALGIPDDVHLLGTVARYHPQKDHANLLRALAGAANQGHEFQLALIGTGMTTDNSELVTLARDLGLLDRVHLLGRRDDIPVVMNGLDLHVLSSASEGFPNTVAEAMFCGTPCVVTRVGDSALIAGPMGWVAEPGDPSALQQMIERALLAMADRDAWNARKHAARQHVIARFGIERMVAAFHRSWGNRAVDPPLRVERLEPPC